MSIKGIFSTIEQELRQTAELNTQVLKQTMGVSDEIGTTKFALTFGSQALSNQQQGLIANLDSPKK